MQFVVFPWRQYKRRYWPEWNMILKITHAKVMSHFTCFKINIIPVYSTHVHFPCWIIKYRLRKVRNLQFLFHLLSSLILSFKMGQMNLGKMESIEISQRRSQCAITKEFGISRHVVQVTQKKHADARSVLDIRKRLVDVWN